MWRIVLYASIGYVIFTLIVFIFQRKLLYLPDTFLLSEQQVRGQGLRYWPSVENYRGYIADQASFSSTKGTIIVFHGNAGAAHHREFYVKALSAHGIRVILAEYPGYGARDGQPSERVIVNDAIETIRLAYQMYGDPMYLWGESLGSGVISSAASKTEIPLKGIILFLPWDSLSNLAQTHFWYLPARWLVLDKYNSIKNLQQFSGNIAVILAEDDEVIPVQHGQTLYDSLTATKKLWMFENARHNEVPVAPDLKWWKEVVDFISQ